MLINPCGTIFISHCRTTTLGISVKLLRRVLMNIGYPMADIDVLMSDHHLAIYFSA